MLWLARHGLSLMPITAMVFALRSISSMIAGSLAICDSEEFTLLCSLVAPASPLGWPAGVPCFLHVQIVAGFGRDRRSPPFRKQIAAQKRLEVAVEDLVHVAHLNLGAMIL